MAPGLVPGLYLNGHVRLNFIFRNGFFTLSLVGQCCQGSVRRHVLGAQRPCSSFPGWEGHVRDLLSSAALGRVPVPSCLSMPSS